MYFETSYPGCGLSDLSGGAFQAAVGAGFTGTKQEWKAGGRQTPAGYTPPVTHDPVTLPTTEPNQCPPGMTYSAPPAGSGTGHCTGSIIPGATGAGPALGVPGSGASGGGIGDLLGSISPTVWLIVAGVALFVILKK